MTWNDVLNEILSTDEMITMKAKLDEERKNFTILPEKKDMFNAFMLCPYEKTRIVILGQDPFPDPIHANGLSFSSKSKQTPASLSNIFKEIQKSLYPNEEMEDCFKTNDLSSWASQGVLLLNTCLTVRSGEPGSHKDLGWDYFTDRIMQVLNKHDNAIVFMLWGAHAKKYASRIDDPRHLILQSAHPSPLSAHTGFNGNMHFSMAQAFLRKSFYQDLTTTMGLCIDTERIKSRTEKFFTDNGIEISKGNIMHIYNMVFDDIGLFFDELIPPLKDKHWINFKT